MFLPTLSPTPFTQSAKATAGYNAISPFSSGPFTSYLPGASFTPNVSGTLHSSVSYVGASPFNMNTFPFNVPPRNSTIQNQSSANAQSYNTNLFPQLISGISNSLSNIQSLLLTQHQNNYLYGGQALNQANFVYPNNNSANINQSLFNFFLKNGLASANSSFNNSTPSIGGDNIIALLLQLLNIKNTGSIILPDLPVLPTPPSINPGAGPGVWGDPHFTTKYGNFDFQGIEGLKTSDKPVYRLYDNGVSKINVEYAANDSKTISVISDLSAKVGDNVVKYDAADKKLTVDGKEVKAGESVSLPHTGIKVDGREIAGSVSIDDTGKVQLDIGDRILNFSSPGSWSGHPYIDLTTTNTQVGTQSTDAGNGKAYRQGGTLGFVDGVTKDDFKKYTGGGKDAIEKLFNDTFHVGGLDDFSGWKGFGDSKTDYKYGVNANETTGAT